MEGKDAKSIWRDIKQISMMGMASKEARKQVNKQEGKQKVVFTRDKYRFGSNVHSFMC